MYALYLIILLLFLIIANWRYLGLHKVFGHPLDRMQRCRWKLDPVTKHDQLKRYTCATCGVDAYSSGDLEPRVCRRNDRRM